MEEVFSVFHKVNLFQKQIGLLLAEILLYEDFGSSLLQLVVSSFDFLDVYLLFFIHFWKPIVHDLLLVWSHCSKRVEKVPGPHNLRVHDDLINKMISVSNQLVISLATCVAACAAMFPSSSIWCTFRRICCANFSIWYILFEFIICTQILKK